MEPLLPDHPPAERTIEGTVLRSTGSWYVVRPDDVAAEGEAVQARVRGKFRLQAEELAETNPVAIGDRVTVRVEADGTGLITGIHPRRNQLSRRAAGRRVGLEQVLVTNVDAAWVVQATFLPKFNPGFVDRFLVMAEAYSLKAGLVINKSDLLKGQRKAQAAVRFWRRLYAGLGYPVLMTSAETGDGVGELREALVGKTSVVAGPSGVGKSSLLNAADPSLGIRTGEVSDRTRKGKHTTTFATLHPLEAGGYVADTPGLREYGIWDMEPEDLAGYFVEMKPFIHACRFPDCTHDHEPGCAVTDAVDAGAVSDERYGSYLNILQALRDGEADVGR